MKTKEKTSLHNMNVSELRKVIAETEKKLGQFMVNRQNKQSKNVKEGWALRRKIAVAATILHEKELVHE